MPRFGRDNKDTYSWALENSRTNTGLEYWRTRSGKNISTAQNTSANAKNQHRDFNAELGTGMELNVSVLDRTNNG